MAMLLLVSLLGAGLAFSSEGRRGAEDQSLAKVPSMVFYQIADMAHHGDGPSVLISIVRSDRGFALGPDDEILPFWLQVEKVRGIDPSQVRRLLGENRTLGEIKAEILGDDRAYFYRGSMRLGRAHYVLDDLNITSDDLNSTLEANVMEPVWGAIPTALEPDLEMVGRISIDFRSMDGSGIGVGSLVIFSGSYAGSYAVLLDSSVGIGCGMETCPVWGGDLAGLDAFSEVRQMCQQGFRHTFSAWGGAVSPVSFWDMISCSPGVSSTSGPGYGGAASSSQSDPSEMMPWNFGRGEPSPEVFGLPRGRIEGDLAGFVPGDSPNRFGPMVSEI